MSSMTLFPNNQNNNLSNLWQTGWRQNRPLMLTGILSVGLLIFTAFGLIFDQRTLLGEPIWIKPTKFAISSIFYTLTLLWFLTHIEGRQRLVRVVSWVTAITMLVELALIVFQAARGVRSHFNNTSTLDITIFSIMGTMIVALWVASLIALIFLVRQSFENRAWGITLKWALFITVIGSGLGFLMTNPTAQQLATAQAGGGMPEVGAHTVGAPDGGPGLPFVGWSTEAGDLRIGHFIGMHAMQIIPLLGAALFMLNRRMQNRFSERQLTNLMHTFSAAFLAIVGLITLQALRAEPLIYPSTFTLSLLGGILFITAFSLYTFSRPRFK